VVMKIENEKFNDEKTWFDVLSRRSLMENIVLNIKHFYKRIRCRISIFEWKLLNKLSRCFYGNTPSN
jgi:hypothetical protein